MLLAAQSPSFSAGLSPHVFRLLAVCIDIRSVWSIDHAPDEEAPEAAPPRRLLAFGDRAMLERLRKCEALQPEGVELLVVVDDDAFETAWGASRISGSLARWAWRETSPREAYYDESRWAGGGDAGAVVRVRRKALLLWRAA
jgi:hypothetical protein